MLEPALLSASLGEATSEDGTIHSSARRAGEELFVIAVNPTEETVSGRVLLSQVAPELTCSTTADAIFEDRKVAVTDGAINDDFGPLAVHVYKLTIE